MLDSSQDDELAALLDEGLFGEGVSTVPAEDCSEQPAAAESAAVVAQDAPLPPSEAEALQQAAKRARLDGSFEAGSAPGGAAGGSAEQQQQQVCPPHPGWWMDMCIRCGSKRTPADMDPAQAGSQAGAAAASAKATRIKHLHHRQALEVRRLQQHGPWAAARCAASQAAACVTDA